MNTSTLKTIARRSLSLAGVASVAAMILPGVAAAAPTGQLTVRSATLSNSKVSPTTPAGTSVSISVKNAVAGTITGVVVSFCTTPTYGTCSHVTGLSASGVTLTSSSYTGLGSPVDTTDTVTLSGGSKTVSAGGPDTIVLAGLVNPTGYGTFYVRVQTQTGAAVDHDFGGIAVSTAKAITVTADVQEEMVFRVANSISTCDGVGETDIADPNDPASDIVTLSPNPITTSAVSSGTAQFCAVTNAQNGYIITYADWGTNSYDNHAGFWNGAHEFNAGGITSFASTPGTEQFGFNVADTAPTGGAGWTLATNYNTTSAYSYNDSGTPVQLVSTVNPATTNIYTMTFKANVSAVTPGGTYRAHQMLVCTSTF